MAKVLLKENEMSLAKQAQMNLDGESVPVLEYKDVLSVEDEMQLKDEPSIEVESDEEPEEVILVSEGPKFLGLPLVPGGDFQDDIEEPAELEVDEPEEDIEVTQDPWKWKLDTLLDWAGNKLNNVPRHSGKDSLGLERTIAYLQTIDKELSRGARMDVDGILDIDLLERMREEIHNAVKRCEDRLEKIQNSKYSGKKKKRADEQTGLVKEAQKSGGFVVAVPLLISAIARTLINSTVSAGHDMERSFKKLSDKYNLNDREKLEVVQLLMDMGFPLPRMDRGLLGEDFNPSSSDNFDYNGNFPA